MRLYTLIIILLLQSFNLLANEKKPLKLKKITFSCKRMRPITHIEFINFSVSDESEELLQLALSKITKNPHAKLSLLGIIDIAREELDLFPLKAREGQIDFEEEALESIHLGKAIVHFEPGNWNYKAFSPRAKAFLTDFTYKAKGLAGHLQAIIRKYKDDPTGEKAVNTKRLNNLRAFTLILYYDLESQTIHCEVDGKSLSVNFQRWFLSKYFPKPSSDIPYLKKEMHNKRDLVKETINHSLMQDPHCFCEQSFFIPIAKALKELMS